MVNHVDARIARLIPIARRPLPAPPGNDYLGPMSELLDPAKDTAGITLSDRAAARIAKILAGEADGAMLRVAVNGGGCSGFQYDFEITTDRNEDDLLITNGGVTVLVDEISSQYMSNAVIDYADELIGASFKIQNPNATASCGCGTSFSV